MQRTEIKGDWTPILEEVKRFRESMDRLSAAFEVLSERLGGIEETLDAVFNLEKGE